MTVLYVCCCLHPGNPEVCDSVLGLHPGSLASPGFSFALALVGLASVHSYGSLSGLATETVESCLLSCWLKSY